MFFGNHAQLGLAAKIPVPDPSPVLSYSPVVLDHVPNRPAPLQMRVSVPSPSSSSSTSSSEPLPVILLAHGLGLSSFLSSHEGYAPLADFLAGRGFAVIQPTFLYSRFYDPAKFHWKTSVRDLTQILDRLDEIEAAVPGLLLSSSSSGGRRMLDRERIAIVGHSFGAATVNLLLGVVNTDTRFPGEAGAAMFGGRDARIKAGVLMAVAGSGPLETEAGRKILPFYGRDFGQLRAPTLVVAGDSDASGYLTTRGPEFHMDAYRLAPGPKDLLTVRGGLHCLGGVDGWDAVGTPDTDPQRLGAVQRMTWAYLRSQLYEGDTAWADACEALKGLGNSGTSSTNPSSNKGTKYFGRQRDKMFRKPALAL
ncbi:hypothetical protein PG994_003796 [Apiospora phragmitis]|uniref:AB hydrolase-1 domain-containing protein n=1 Tax=Apiospora phragmitis TaxID=2905665 RepID=A0ABR1VZ58_9PEZI